MGRAFQGEERATAKAPPEVGMCVACSRNSKEANVYGEEKIGEEG